MSHHRLRTMLLSALMAALTAVGAFLRIPMWPAAITLQFFFSALSGVLLGPVWGAVSQGVYVALGLLGLPVFTEGGGLGYLLKPSFGFLLGLIPAAAAAGAVSRMARLGRWRYLAGAAAGEVVLYAVGVPYMYMVMHFYLEKAVTVWGLWGAMAVYLPGDVLKILALTALAPALLRRLPRQEAAPGRS